MVQSIEDTRRRQPSGVGRVPPHNLEAEESLLGAMLLSRDAIVAAVEAQVSGDDFYKPAHGHVFEAITSLYGQGEPADPVTVAEALRRAGVLDAVGGPAVLISLQARTPAIGNATRYASIVEEYALLRRLIAVAGQIAELGYSVPDDVLATIDTAESLVFEVAQRRVTDSMLPIRELLERHLDHIEALYERAQDIIGVPTGYLDLDQQLAGLQPSNLVIVGGRPGTGKALSVDTPIATPTGWTTMGDLRVGDEVFDEQGRPCRVTFATPVMTDRPCYEVTFDDGATLVADADHQWFAYDDVAPSGRIVTTRQILDEGVRRPHDGPPAWHVPLTAPLQLPEADLPTDPYLLGRALGETSGASVQVFDARTRACGPVTVGLVDRAAKCIPASNLRASAEQRTELLRGLLDADGTVDPRTGVVALGITDCPLVEQVRELVCSLGYKPGPAEACFLRSSDGRRVPAWRLHWTVPGSGRSSRRAITTIRAVASVPVRCITVDSPTQLYLAGRSMIPTHNTSFALGIGAHAALDANVPVLIFSLEMSHLELTQRLLCSEARVDATRMRNGRLLDTDWPKISHAVGRLAEAPINIDDNPHLTVMEIRAKARRLKSRQGLGLIVIDYLQLMTGRQSAENRQVEVSEISRGLKILARELEVPVVALSQLSRNLETRADKRPVLADLRESGCLTADTRVLRADTGAEVTMGELFVRGERDIPVWSLDESMKMVPAKMRRVFSTGVKPVFDLTLASGRRVKATANHPFLTLRGWTHLDDLRVGDRIAVPRTVPEPQQSASWPEAELVMLAHLLGDGCFVARQPVRYTSADLANVRAVENAAEHFGVTPRRVRQQNWWHVYLPAPQQLARGRRNPVAAWLASLGLYGLHSWDKFVPSSVFGLARDQLAVFLRHLWATDGSVGFFGGQSRIYYASTSRALVDGVQQLLLRFEIQTRISKVRKSGYRTGFHLNVIGAANQLRFVDTIGIHGTRGAHAHALRPHLEATTKQPYGDSVPFDVWGRILAKAKNLGLSRHALIQRAGFAQSFSRTPPNRARLERIADVLDDDNLRRIATSDVLWDRVVSVRPLGEEVVFDATVDDTHNFVANGVTSSNSLEQDADVVVFLYRDELYNRDSPDRGTAEVIVAKHRNGPTGVTQLAFLENYTRFANMARGV